MASVATTRSCAELAATEVLPGRFITRSMKAYAIVGLAFMLLPGTLLGVWNLINISGSHTSTALDPAWIQAHGHAQIFGWVSTFILGIGFYSLPQSRRHDFLGVDTGWITLALWTLGNILRWLASVYWVEWRVLLPLSAFLELLAFLLFFRAVAGHRPSGHRPGGGGARLEPWTLVVMAGTLGMLVMLLGNFAMTAVVALRSNAPALPAALDQPLLIVATWSYLVLFVLGFSARWLPIFLGLRATSEPLLLLSSGVLLLGAIAGAAGFLLTFAVITIAGVLLAVTALRLFAPTIKLAKVRGVHVSFPLFVRIAYVWLAVAGGLQLWAAIADRHRGIWGASRHALTVGFIAVMVFAVGQRVLPHFAGLQTLFSTRLMFACLLLLNLGCTTRVVSQIVAYEGFGGWAWRVLPVSAVTELCAVTLFALNLFLTFAFSQRLGYRAAAA